MSASEWTAATEPVFSELQRLQAALTDNLVERSTPVAIWVIVRLVLAGVLGLAAVIASIVISITTARKLVRQLGRLRNAAHDLASYRLPRVVERLQHGERVDVEVEAPPLAFGKDEIGQVGEAFNQVQETAVRVAVEQAELRRSVRDVFLSLARRSQALLHRQLGLLDAMERRATDSEELAELFRIDHLATRMRRNAENLIVLSGATAGRAWRKPVPMVDVLRGALAEVEDYTRVTVLPVGSASLLGRAVGDVIHLLAELIENAVSFSPPQTVVRVGGSVVGYGFAIEIEDRGLGMSAEELEAANEQLRKPPEFRLTSTARLGLYVVGKLAERHGIRVRLTESPYGGTTAIVLLPGTLIADGDDDRGGDAGDDQHLAAIGRHRLRADVTAPAASAAGVLASTELTVRPSPPALPGHAPPAPVSVEAAGTVADDPGAGDPVTDGWVAYEAVVSGDVTMPNGAASRNGVIVEAAVDAAPAMAPLSTTAGEPSSSTSAAADDTPPSGSSAGPVPTQRRSADPPVLTPSGLPWRPKPPKAGPGSAPPSPSLPPPAGTGDVPGATTQRLVGDGGSSPGNGHGLSGASSERGPDQTRSLMASYRSGTLRGRTDAARLTRQDRLPPEWTESTSEPRAKEEEG